MNESRKLEPYLHAILLAMEAIESYCPQNEQQLRDDPMRADAILMRLQEIGEIMYTIRNKFEHDFEAHHDSDWHKIIGLRHLISHEYGSVDLAIIWVVIIEKLPELKEQIEKWLTNR